MGVGMMRRRHAAAKAGAETKTTASSTGSALEQAMRALPPKARDELLEAVRAELVGARAALERELGAAGKRIAELEADLAKATEMLAAATTPTAAPSESPPEPEAAPTPEPAKEPEAKLAEPEQPSHRRGRR